MEKLDFFTKFYLDKEKDIIVNLYRSKPDELTYILGYAPDWVYEDFIRRNNIIG